jgi:hypothetical protein
MPVGDPWCDNDNDTCEFLREGPALPVPEPGSLGLLGLGLLGPRPDAATHSELSVTLDAATSPATRRASCSRELVIVLVQGAEGVERDQRKAMYRTRPPQAERQSCESLG